MGLLELKFKAQQVAVARQRFFASFTKGHEKLMIGLPKQMESGSGFGPIVARVLNHAVGRSRPNEVYVVQVEGWFDYKWQQFSGTVMPEIALWRNRLTVPPFHPSRVLNERYFRYIPDMGTYEVASAKPLHQASAENLRRSIRDVSSSGVFLWYSQVGKDSDRASLMVYTIGAREAGDWYAGFTRKDEWRLAVVNGTSRHAFRKLLMSVEP